MIGTAIKRECTAKMLFDCLPGDEKANAHAMLFRAEERLEDSFAFFFRDTLAPIFYGERDSLGIMR